MSEKPMTLSDKSIEAAAKVDMEFTPFDISWEEMPEIARQNYRKQISAVIAAYLASEQSQGRDWMAMEALLPEIEEFLIEYIHETHDHDTSQQMGVLLAKLRAAMGKA